MRARGRQVEHEIDSGAAINSSTSSRCRPCSSANASAQAVSRSAQRDGPPALERRRVLDVARGDDPAADDADLQRRHVGSILRTARSERSTAPNGSGPTSSSSTRATPRPPPRPPAEPLVADDAVADRHVVSALAAREVLQVHDRAAPRRAVELLRGVGVRLPDPAEVELEPEQLGGQLAQQVEERAAVVEGSQLGPVVVEAEVDSGLLECVRNGLDARHEGLVEPVGIDPAERKVVRAERRQLGAELLGLVSRRSSVA